MATLKTSREKAAQLLTDQMEVGTNLMGEIRQAPNETAYDRRRLDRSRWRDTTQAVLGHIYAEEEPIKEFEEGKPRLRGGWWSAVAALCEG